MPKPPASASHPSVHQPSVPEKVPKTKPRHRTRGPSPPAVADVPVTRRGLPSLPSTAHPAGQGPERMPKPPVSASHPTVRQPSVTEERAGQEAQQTRSATEPYAPPTMPPSRPPRTRLAKVPNGCRNHPFRQPSVRSPAIPNGGARRTRGATDTKDTRAERSATMPPSRPPRIRLAEVSNGCRNHPLPPAIRPFTRHPYPEGPGKGPRSRSRTRTRTRSRTAGHTRGAPGPKPERPSRTRLRSRTRRCCPR